MMFSTIREGLELYKTELRKYVERVYKIEAKGHTALTLTSPERHELTVWSAKLDGMADALGLSKRGRINIERRCGIKHSH